MTVFAATLLLAATLSRAERIERFKAPVLTQAEGLVKVYATCAPDVRREFQSPVARFAGETVTALANAARRRLARAREPVIALHLGDVRTNDARVVTRVATNGTRVLTRLFLPNPACADVTALRTELARAYFRAVEGREVPPDEALEAFRLTDPGYRVARERQRLADWLLKAKGPDDEGFRLLTHVFRPGTLSAIEARVFASRLFLYPSTHDRKFLGRFDSLDFRSAIDAAKRDPFVRLAAADKANLMPVFGGGRGEALAEAAAAYRAFLLALASGKVPDDALRDALESAEAKLAVAFERAAVSARRATGRSSRNSCKAPGPPPRTGCCRSPSCRPPSGARGASPQARASSGLSARPA